MYDASLHCADAWRCLAERAEQLSGIDRRRGWGAGEGGNRVGGASGDGGADDFLGSARAMEDVHDIIPRWDNPIGHVKCVGNVLREFCDKDVGVFRTCLLLGTLRATIRVNVRVPIDVVFGKKANAAD